MLARLLLLLLAATLGVVGCVNQGALDKAIAEGDVEKMTYICERRHLGFMKPPSEEVKERACKARDDYERAQIPKLSCEKAAEQYAWEASREPLPAAAAVPYAERMVACENWLTLWSVTARKAAPIHIREAKTPRGEAALRETIANAPGSRISSIVFNLEAVEAASGPVVVDDVAAVYERIPSDDRERTFRYLVHHKHPRGKELTAKYLSSTSPHVRRLACWAAGELGDPDLRDLVARVAASDSYSELSETRNGNAIARRFVVREACSEALPKLTS